MAGTKEGGIKTRETNKRLHGEDYYSKLGKLGGSAKVPKGFAKMDKEKLRLAGVKGGKKSKRTKTY